MFLIKWNGRVRFHPKRASAPPKKKTMKHLQIATWNLVIGSAILIASAFWPSIRVFAFIVFASAAGIFLYHSFFKTELKYAERATYQLLKRVAIGCTAVSFLFYQLLPYQSFLIAFGIIFSVGGVIGIFLLHTHPKEE